MSDPRVEQESVEFLAGLTLAGIGDIPRELAIKVARDLLDARRERDEAIKVIKLLVERAAQVIGTHPIWTNENTNTGVVEAALGYLEQLMGDRKAARAAEKEG